MFIVRWERAQGAVVRRKDAKMEPEAVRDNWDTVTDFEDSTHPTSIQGK